MKPQLNEYWKQNAVILDGGMGTLLQAKGLLPGELPETWNLTHREDIIEIHSAYLRAGSMLISTNTFGANSLKFSEEDLDSILRAAIENGREAIRRAAHDISHPTWLALDIGPTGHLPAPIGDLDFEDAVACFRKTVELGVKYGVDAILIETMSDSYETKAALLAAKEACSLPILVSCAYGEDGKLMTGAAPEAMVAMLEGLGADAIGVNCSLGPKALAPIVDAYLACASVPVLLKPNAGLPRVVDGKTTFDVTEEEFAAEVARMIQKGVRLAGGCCGTTPAHIAALTKAACGMTPPPLTDKNLTVISSFTHARTFSTLPLLIGERINPTGKKRFREALLAEDYDYILREGLRQQENGAHILDVNVGLPDIDETTILKEAVCRLQAVCDLPLQIDTSSPEAMEAALRRYNGKAMINSVSGKEESMRAVFPLAKKYGGVIVALTLDENGIPESAEERLAIAERICKRADEAGIARKNLIFDPLALTISADPHAAAVTLQAVREIHEKLGCHTILGVSNVSFGLPMRELVTASFFTLALGNGLSGAIMNPDSLEMQKAYHTYLALSGLDQGCQGYITFVEEKQSALSLCAPSPAAPTQTSRGTEQNDGKSELRLAVEKGLVERAAHLTAAMIARGTPPTAIMAEEIIPALETVGDGFEKKLLYLPRLLMSAEAAGMAFEQIKATMPTAALDENKKIVLATVKGDIHDIGKNIVKLLLESYGFAVIDLGRDVPPEVIVNAARESGARLVGLSALMTTTVPAMEETIALLRKKAPQVKVVVGGAVLNEAYAAKIGADRYARDAMETVRYAEQILSPATESERSPS